MLRRVFLFIIFLAAVFFVLFMINTFNTPAHPEQITKPEHAVEHDVITKEEHKEEVESKAVTTPLSKQEQEGKLESKVKEEKRVVKAKKENADLYVVGLGDSLTQGVGDRFHQGYIGIIEQQMEEKSHLKIALNNHAKRGQRSDQLLKKLKNKDVIQDIKEADFIFLTIGGNDVMRVFKTNFFNLDVDLFENKNKNFQNNLREIFTTIRQANPDAPVYMIGLFNPYLAYFSEIVEIGEVVQIWNEGSMRIISDFSNVHFVSIDSIFTDDEELLLHDDFFHPNRLGYERIADKLLDQMEIEGDFVFVP